MPRTCPSCGTRNPDEARFCFACATPVAEASERRERKFATALFADIVGSTALGEREDPEVVRGLIERTLERLARHVSRFGGTLERFMGDGMLAVFGVPAAHEDDPERAVRAGLAMLADVEALAAELAAEGRPPIRVRVGLEAGEVLVDLDRVAGPRDRMLTGDAVNTAARLQAAAEPGRLLVGPQVYESTRAAVAYRTLPALRLKGKAEPVPAWEALGLTAGTKRDRTMRARLVGREHELELLRSAFTRTLAEGHPTVVTVLGDAGVGKSRLAQEWAASLSPEVRRLEGRCLAYGDRSYSALAELVQATCGVLDDDPPETIAGKVGAAVAGDEAIVPQLLSLLGVSGRRFGREELFDAWRRFLERLAAAGPLVVVMEDLHWADDGLLDFVDHLATWGSGPIYLLALARPTLLEARPGWGGGRQDALVVSLDVLSPGEVTSMLDDLLGAPAPPALVSLVTDRAGGNPLFGGEIVRMLVDRGVIAEGDGGWVLRGDVGDVEIPRTIHALLASRLDALPAEQKRLLQDAAVVGRTFWAGALRALAPQRDPEGLLDALAGKDLIERRGGGSLAGERAFAFHHVLIRDVAYESLPKSLRWPKHRTVAGWLEDQGRARREEFAEQIATHLLRALRYLDELGERSDAAALGEATAWSRLAGARAYDVWQPGRAVRWYRIALDLAARAELPPAEVAPTWEAYGRAAEGVEPYEAVSSALERALSAYEVVGAEADAGRVQAWLAWAAYRSGREDEILPLAERALARLEPLGDGRDLAMTLRILGRYQRRRGNTAEAERTLRRAMEIAERVGDDVSRAWAMITLGPILRADGGVVGMRLAEQGLELAKRTGDLALIVQAFVDLSEGYEEILGDYGRAEELMREGLETARRAGNGANVSWLEGNLADYLVDQGRLDEALGPAEHALRVAREVSDRVRVAYCLDTIAYIRALRMEVEEAASLLAEARDIERAHPDTWLAGWLPLVGGLIERARGRSDEAVRTLVDGADRLGDRAEVWGGAGLQLECVRSLVSAGSADEATRFRDRLDRMATFSVPARALLAWAEGLLESDPTKRVALLTDASGRLEGIERSIDLGRCFLDLAAAAGLVGGDASSLFERGRDLLARTGATLFLQEAVGPSSASSDADTRREGGYERTIRRRPADGARGAP